MNTEIEQNFSVLRQSFFFYLFWSMLIFAVMDFDLLHHQRLQCVRGGHLYSEGRPLDSLLYYDYRVHLNPRDWKAYLGLAENYYFVGQYQKALKAYDQALLIEPKEARLDQSVAMKMNDARKKVNAR